MSDDYPGFPKGGPAFPTIIWDPAISPDPRASFATIQGMSLRDYFAAAAFPSAVQICQSIVQIRKESLEDNVEALPTVAAALAYEMAIAMLEARKR